MLCSIISPWSSVPAVVALALTVPFDANFAHLKDSSGTFPVEADRPKNLTRLVLGGIVSNGAIATADLTFTPEASSDLTMWNSAECVIVSVTDDGNGLTETVIVRDTQPVAHHEKRFLRLRVAQ
jgi:hypothetical protein